MEGWVAMMPQGPRIRISASAAAGLRERGGVAHEA